MRKQLNCPSTALSTMNDVFADEYNMPITFEPYIILDIGANIGAYTEWARAKWPLATIYAYEPNPENAMYFRKNFHDLTPNVIFTEAAVSDTIGYKTLFTGNGSCTHSLFKNATNDDQGHEVSVIDALHLPNADLVKIDTEGSEPQILSRLLAAQRPKYIIFEWHSREDRAFCSGLLAQNGYKLTYELDHKKGYGVLGYERS